MRQYDAAIDHLRKALNIFNQIPPEEKDQHNIAHLYFALALLYFEKADYDLQLVNLKKTLHVHTIKPALPSTMIFDIHQHIAICYQIKKRYDLAIKHYITSSARLRTRLALSRRNRTSQLSANYLF